MPTDGIPHVLGSAPVLPDGTFALRNVVGRSLLTVAGDDAIHVKGVYVNGADVTAEGLPIDGAQDIRGVRIVIEPRLEQVGGVVHDDTGRTVSDCVVLWFSARPSQWTDPTGRYVKVARTGLAGMNSATYRRPR